MDEEQKREFTRKWLVPVVALISMGLLTCHILFDTVDKAAIAAIERYERNK